MPIGNAGRKGVKAAPHDRMKLRLDFFGVHLQVGGPAWPVVLVLVLVLLAIIITR